MNFVSRRCFIHGVIHPHRAILVVVRTLDAKCCTSLVDVGYLCAVLCLLFRWWFKVLENIINV